MRSASRARSPRGVAPPLKDLGRRIRGDGGPRQHVDGRVETLAQRLKVVAALGDRNQSARAELARRPPERRDHPPAAGGRDTHLRERIAGVNVEAGGHEDQVGRELGQYRLDARPKHEVVVGVGRAGFEREVHGRAGASSVSHFRRRSGARVVRELVRRHVEHVGIRIEDPLRAVAMMHVEVDDGDARQALRTGVGRRDGDVVEQTKAHRAIALGVMARRTHERERRTVAGERVLDAGEDGARGERGDIAGVWRGEGVGVEAHGASGRLGDRADVVGCVDGAQLVVGRGPRRRNRATAIPPAERDALQDLRALDPLGVSGWREVMGEALGADDEERHLQILSGPDRRYASSGLTGSGQ